MAEIIHVSKYGGNNGSIDLTVTGGTSPYSISWSNGKYTEDLINLIAGTYIVIVSDANNITKSDTFIVNQPSADPLILILIGKDVTEYGGSDGAAYANVSGGITPYTYNWSNGSNEKDITRLVSDIYSLTVTDAEGNTITDSIFISQSKENEIVIKYIAKNPTDGSSEDGSIDITVSGGYPPYSFLWSNGSETEDLTGLSNGAD